ASQRWQRRQVVLVDTTWATGDARHVLDVVAGPDGQDARRLLRRLDVDAGDAGVGGCRAHEGNLGRILELQVVDVLTFATQQSGVFDPLAVDANLVLRFGAGGHDAVNHDSRGILYLVATSLENPQQASFEVEDTHAANELFWRNGWTDG